MKDTKKHFKNANFRPENNENLMQIVQSILYKLEKTIENKSGTHNQVKLEKISAAPQSSSSL